MASATSVLNSKKCIHFIDQVSTLGHEIKQEGIKRKLAIIEMNMESVTTKMMLLDMLANELKFPDYFGHNWDALDECISDLSWFPADGYVLIFQNIRPFLDISTSDFLTLLDILIGASNYWKTQSRTFRAIFIDYTLTKDLLTFKKNCDVHSFFSS